MFDFLYRGPKGRNDIIKTTVEEEGEKYLESIYMLKNSFYVSFFEECINSTTADDEPVSAS